MQFAFSAAVRGLTAIFLVSSLQAQVCPAIDDAFEENDTCDTALPLADGLYSSLYVEKTDKDFFSFCVPDGATVDIHADFMHSQANLDIFLWDANALDCGTGFNGSPISSGATNSDDEDIIWQNTLGVDLAVIIEVNVWQGSNGDCTFYDLDIGGSGCVGAQVTVACDPASFHSGFTWAKLDSSSATGPGAFHLECTDGPPGEFGYFLVSSTLLDPGMLVSNGFLCLALPMGRYNPGAATANANPSFNSLGSFDASGVFQNIAGTSAVGSGFDVPVALPNPPGGSISMGQTWVFQCWFRDTLGGQQVSNFSNALSVQF